MTQISRTDLLCIDSADDRIEGFVTLEEVENTLGNNDPWLHLAHERGLFDDTWRLPYAKYLDAFGSGLKFWGHISSRVEDIPVIDMLSLGKKMEDLRGRVNIRLDSHKRGAKDADRALVNPSSLLADLLSAFNEDPRRIRRNYQSLDSHQGVLGTDDPLSRAAELFLKVLKDPDTGKTDPREIFKDAAQAYLLSLDADQVVDCEGADKDFCDHVRNLKVYHHHSKQEGEALFDQTLALLAFEASYLFSTTESCLWGYEVHSLHLSYNAEHFAFFPVVMTNNPFLINHDPSIRVEGFWSSTRNLMAIRAQAVEQESGGYDLHGGNYVPAPSVSTHETAHALLDQCYPWTMAPADEPSPRLVALEYVDYFVSLDADLYKAVFLGEDYGHPSWIDRNPRHRRSYDPHHETHSRLAELVALGPDFPEIVRKRLAAHRHWTPAKIAEITKKLREFRNFTRQYWGLRPTPSWADRLEKANQSRGDLGGRPGTILLDEINLTGHP